MTSLHSQQPGTVLMAEPIIQPFKGEEYNIIHYFWYNPITKQSFDTTETADATLNQIYNAFRINHGIKFPDELISLRRTLGLTPAKMSSLLGIDPSKYRFYENGAIPMDELCQQRLQILNTKTALRECVETQKDLLTVTEYEQAIQWCDSPDEVIVYSHLLHKRDKANGYAPIDDDRLKNAILHFLVWRGATDPIYLNRILFYTDFLAYRTRGMAITGLTYIATTQGPAPKNWNFIGSVDGVLGMETESGIKYYTKSKVDYSCFSKSEVKILNNVFREFANVNTAELSKLSRQEDAWKESDHLGETPISFDYAFTLKAI